VKAGQNKGMVRCSSHSTIAVREPSVLSRLQKLKLSMLSGSCRCCPEAVDAVRKLSMLFSSCRIEVVNACSIIVKTGHNTTGVYIQVAQMR
jgi:hypothetical protein